jgi:hypothetical protein
MESHYPLFTDKFLVLTKLVKRAVVPINGFTMNRERIQRCFRNHFFPEGTS